MNVYKITNGMFDSNTYIVTTDDKNALIIDLGADFWRVNAVLEEHNLTPICVLFTHGHFDHVFYAEAAYKHNIPLWISTNDRKMLESGIENLSDMCGLKYRPVTDYKTFTEGEYLFGSTVVKILETPGHTKGSVCFIIEDCIFTGDTLFKNTVGRQDFPTGSVSDMKNSINRLIGLHFNFKVYPGHYESTTIENEILTNPYILELKNA